MHCETNRFKFLHKSHKADFSILTNWKKKKKNTSMGWRCGGDGEDLPSSKSRVGERQAFQYCRGGRSRYKITSVFSCSMFLISLNFNMNEIIWVGSNLTMLHAHNWPYFFPLWWKWCGFNKRPRIVVPVTALGVCKKHTIKQGLCVQHGVDRWDVRLRWCVPWI